MQKKKKNDFNVFPTVACCFNNLLQGKLSEQTSAGSEESDRGSAR